MADLVLEFIVQEAAFAETRHHFLAFQLNQERKVRTEVAPPGKHATFLENRFNFTVPHGLRGDGVVIEDVLYIALFGVALKPEVGNLIRFIGASSLSLHEIREELLRDGMCEVEVTLTRLLRREGTSLPVAIVKMQVRALGEVKLTHTLKDRTQAVDIIDPELRIHVLGGFDIPREASGREVIRPYVELRLVHDSEAGMGLSGIQIGKTREALTTRGVQTLYWNESFVTDVAEGLEGMSLVVQVLDERGHEDEDELLAERRLRLHPMPTHECTPVFLQLTRPGGGREEDGGGGPAGMLGLALEYLPDGPMPSSTICLSAQRLGLPPDDAGEFRLPTLALVTLEPRSAAKQLGGYLVKEEAVTLPYTVMASHGHVDLKDTAASQQALGARFKLLGPGKLSDTGARSLWEGPLVLRAEEDMIEALDVDDPQEAPVLVIQWLGGGAQGPPVTFGEWKVTFPVVGYSIIELAAKAMVRSVQGDSVAVVRVSDGTVKPTITPLDVVYNAAVRVSAVPACRRKRKRRQNQKGRLAQAQGEMDGLSTWEDLDLGAEHDDIEHTMASADPNISQMELRVLAMADQLAAKDASLEQLTGELEQRAEAIRNCGSEILRVRRQKDEVEAALRESKEKMGDMEREVDRACSLVVCEDGSRLQRSSLPDLQRVLPILVGRYHAVRRDKDKLQLAFNTLSKQAQLLPGMKSEICKLEKAMLAQGAFIQTLQSRQAKVDNYKTTIRMQEKVIHRLENLLESKLQRMKTQDDGRSPRAQDATPRGATRGAAIDALKEEIRELRAENERLRQVARTANEVALAAKSHRIQAVEEQLIEQSRASAKEISALRMRVFELENGIERDGFVNNGRGYNGGYNGGGAPLPQVPESPQVVNDVDVKGQRRNRVREGILGRAKQMGASPGRGKGVDENSSVSVHMHMESEHSPVPSPSW